MRCCGVILFVLEVALACRFGCVVMFAFACFKICSVTILLITV